MSSFHPAPPPSPPHPSQNPSRPDDGPTCGHCGHGIGREIAFFILRKVVFGGDGIAADWATTSDVAELQRGLATISRTLEALLAQENAEMNELDALKSAVARNTTVIGSAKDLIVGLKAKLDEAIASGDPAQLTALSTELGANDDALASAVADNTPATT